MPSTGFIIAEYACPTIGAILSTLTFAAPIKSLNISLKNGSLGNLNPTPWVFMTGTALITSPYLLFHVSHVRLSEPILALATTTFRKHHWLVSLLVYHLGFVRVFCKCTWCKIEINRRVHIAYPVCTHLPSVSHLFSSSYRFGLMLVPPSYNTM